MEALFYVVLGTITSLSAIYDFVGPAALKADIARWGYRPGFERVLGLIKLAGAWGLFVGMFSNVIGILASIGFVAYFALAINTHKKAADPMSQAIPAIVLMGLSVAALVAGLMA